VKRKRFIFIAISLIVVGLLLCVYFNSNYYYSKKLVSAIKEENIIAIQQIIEKKPTCINTYPSIRSKGYHSAMNLRVWYPLNEACATGNIDLIKLLIENGADVNCNDGFTPLSVIYNGKPDNWYEISLILIENGASLDYTTEFSGKDSSILQDIVQNRPGANAIDYIPDKSEEVLLAFHYALENCDHNKVNWMRALQHSVTNDRIEIVKLLLDQGYCTVNDTSVGMTALMFAARDSTPEMVQLLLDYGADKNLTDSDGKTAYDYAIQFNRTAIIPMLEN